MTIQELRQETRKFIAENPNLKDEISDFYYLAVSEIEEGGSESHECNLAYNDMVELIKESKENDQ
jgi:hypothetical protein